MTAQIFPFPGQPESLDPTPEFYLRVAQGIVANCSSYNLDPKVLAGAIVAAVDTQALHTAAMDDVARKIASVPPAYTAQVNLYAQAERPLPAYCDPANEFRGSKYNRDLDVAEVAKLLRQDIAAARKDGSLVLPKHAKVSVRIDRYSMGCSIDVVVIGCTQAELWNAPDGDVYRTKGGRTPMREAAHAKLTALLNAYKRDNSDSMTDYYDVNFAGHVTFA